MGGVYRDVHQGFAGLFTGKLGQEDGKGRRSE